MPPVSIIGAVIAVAGSVIGSLITSNDLDKAKKETKELAMLKRDDDLAWQKKQEDIARLKIDLEQKGLEFKQTDLLKQRKIEASERGKRDRRQNFADTIGLVNADQNMRNNFVNIWKGAA